MKMKPSKQFWHSEAVNWDESVRIFSKCVGNYLPLHPRKDWLQLLNGIVTLMTHMKQANHRSDKQNP